MGPLPAELGNLSQLESLSIGFNSFTGSIPETFDSLINLYALSLENNELEGPIPTNIATLGNLNLVRFENNKFTFGDLIPFKQNFTGTYFLYADQALADTQKSMTATVGGDITLSASVDTNTTPLSEFQWFKVVDGVTTQLTSPSTSGQAYTINSVSESDVNAEYFYQITNPLLPGLTLISQLQSISTFPIVDVNYIRTIDLMVPNVSDVETATIDERATNFTYFDGLGRPIQNVAQQNSPLGKDVVQPIRYDAFGREVSKYLPIVTGSDGSYKSNEMLIDDDDGSYIGIADMFYNAANGKVANDSRPYSETVFEPSPLNRPTKNYGPGLAWSQATGGADKPVQYQYLTNVHNLMGSLAEEAIIAWKVDSTGSLTVEQPISGYIVSGGYYSSNQLYIQSTIDEHGNSVREYTNKQGQVILKKVQAASGSTDLNDVDEWACTYYVYDDFGNLAFVLPPEGVKQYLSVTQQP